MTSVSESIVFGLPIVTVLDSERFLNFYDILLRLILNNICVKKKKCITLCLSSYIFQIKSLKNFKTSIIVCIINKHWLVNFKNILIDSGLTDDLFEILEKPRNNAHI